MKVELNPRIQFTPKFKTGQRVRITDAGAIYNQLPHRTTGTVRGCNEMVVVEMNLTHRIGIYSPDHWDAITETAERL